MGYLCWGLSQSCLFFSLVHWSVWMNLCCSSWYGIIAGQLNWKGLRSLNLVRVDFGFTSTLYFYCCSEPTNFCMSRRRVIYQRARLCFRILFMFSVGFYFCSMNFMLLIIFLEILLDNGICRSVNHIKLPQFLPY